MGFISLMAVSFGGIFHYSPGFSKPGRRGRLRKQLAMPVYLAATVAFIQR